MNKYYWLFSLSTVTLWGSPNSLEVITGEVSCDASRLQTLTIHASDKAILQWKDFSIDAQEIVHFQLPPIPGASVLNRVVGSLPSHILGGLSSNGHIYLINPNGIILGKSGYVNAAGFTASTLDVANEDFLKGETLLFSGNQQSAIVSEGTVSTWDGDVHFISYRIENKGTIDAQQGTIGLAAGSTLLLKPQENRKIWIQTSKHSSTATIEQTGVLQALQVEIQAEGNPYAYAIKNDGWIEAQTINIGATEGMTLHTGHIFAQTQEGHGGSVDILGSSVFLEDFSTIHASGKSGGGQVRIGGSFDGADPSILHAQETFVKKMALIYADAHLDGDGGSVVVWGNESLDFFGDIYARAGMASGDGGYIEASSRSALQIAGLANSLSLHGKPGMFYIDPADVTLSTNTTFNQGTALPLFHPSGTAVVANVQISAILSALNTGDVTIFTDNTMPPTPGAASGHINIVNDINWQLPTTGARTFNLQALSGLRLADTATYSNSTNNGATLWEAGGSLGSTGALQIDGDVSISPNNTAIHDFHAANGVDININSAIEHEGSGTLVLRVDPGSSGNINIEGRIDLERGSLTVSTAATTTGDINLTGFIQQSGPTGSVLFQSLGSGNIYIQPSDPAFNSIDLETSSTCSITTSSGDINILGRVLNNQSGAIQIATGRNLAIGDGTQLGPAVVGSLNGDVSIQLTAPNSNLQVIGGPEDNTYAQIGYNSSEFAINSDLNFLFNMNNDANVIIRGGTGNGCYAVIGHGNGLVNTGIVEGNINFNASNPIDGSVLLQGGPAPNSVINSFAQIGHLRGTGDGIIATGNIRLEDVGGSIRLQGGSGVGNFALIGHGGRTTTAPDMYVGSLAVSSSTDSIYVIGGTADQAFASIGSTAYFSGVGELSINYSIFSVSADALNLQANSGSEAIIGGRSVSTGGGTVYFSTPEPNIVSPTAISLLGASTGDQPFDVLIGFLASAAVGDDESIGDFGTPLSLTTDNLFLENAAPEANAQSFVMINNGYGSPSGSPHAFDTTITANVDCKLLGKSGRALINGVGSNSDFSLTTGNDLTLIDSSFVNKLGAGFLGVTCIEGNTLVDQDSRLYSDGDMTVLVAAGNLSITNSSVLMTESGPLTVIAGTGDVTLINSSILSEDDCALTVDQGNLLLEQSSDVYSVGNMNVGVAAGNITLFDDSNILADGSSSLDITLGSDLLVQGGTTGLSRINAGGAYTITSDTGNITVDQGELFTTNGNMTVIASAGDIVVRNGSMLSNTGTGSLTVEFARSVVIEHGIAGAATISASPSMGNTMSITGTGINQAISLLSNHSLNYIHRASIQNNGVGALTINSQAVQLLGIDTANFPLISSTGPAIFTVSDRLFLDQFAQITGNQTLTLDTGALSVSNGSQINSTGAMTITSGYDVRIDGNLGGSQNSQITSASTLTLTAENNIFVQGQTTIPGRITAAGALSITSSSGDIDLITGTLSTTTGNMAVTATEGNITARNNSLIRNIGTGSLSVTFGGDMVLEHGPQGDTIAQAAPGMSNTFTIHGTGESSSLSLFANQAESFNGNARITNSGVGSLSITTSYLEMIGWELFAGPGISSIGNATFNIANDILMNLFCGISGSNAITMNVGNLSLANFSQINGTGAINITADTVTLSDMSLGVSQISSSSNNLTMNVTHDVTLNGSSSGAVRLAADGALAITSSAGEIFSNQGAFSAGGALTLSVPMGSLNLINESSIEAEGTMSVSIGHNILIDPGSSITYNGMSDTLSVLTTSGDILIANDANITNNGSAATTISAGGTLSLIGGINGDASIEGNTGAMTITTGSNLHMLSTEGGSAFISNNNDITITSQQNILLGGFANGQQSSITTTQGDILAEAAYDILVRENALIENTGSGNITLVADQIAPTSPAIGNGRFVLDTDATLQTGGLLRVFTARPSQNTVLGTLNGTLDPALGGPPSATEQYSTYFDAFGGGFGTPYTVFYKIPYAYPPTIPPETIFENLGKVAFASAEMLYNLRYFDEYRWLKSSTERYEGKKAKFVRSSFDIFSDFYHPVAPKNIDYFLMDRYGLYQETQLYLEGYD